jgi:hypothetical protein
MRLATGTKIRWMVMRQDFRGLAESGLQSVALSYLDVFLL